MTVNTTYETDKSLKFSDMDTMLMSFFIMRGSDDWIQNRTEWQQSRPTATECALYLCANAYEAKSEGGILQEDIIGSWSVKQKGSFSVDRESSRGFHDDDPLKRRQATLEDQDRWIDLDIDGLYDSGVGKNLLRYDLQLLIPPEQSQGLPDTMPREFNVTHALIRSTIDYLYSFTGRDMDPRSYGLQQDNGSVANPHVFPNIQSPPVVDALWNSTNLTTTFDNVAKSLTKQIRDSSPYRQLHQGSVKQWTTHVRVDWAYLAWPCSLLLIGILYVVLVIIESTRLRLPAWKEKALPTLLYGFSDETQRLLRENETLKLSEKDKMKVQFGFDEREGRIGLYAT